MKWRANDDSVETWKAFHGTTFRAYSLEIVKPQPTVKEVPKVILDEKPKTKWFRDPKTGYWVQVQKPTSKFEITNIVMKVGYPSNQPW